MADTVPALLEPGEFVIKKESANVLGDGILDMLNNADKIFGNEVPSLMELMKPIVDRRAGIPSTNSRQSTDDGVQKFQYGGSVRTEDIYHQLGFEAPSAESEYQPAILPYSRLGEQSLISQARGSLDYTPEGVGGFAGSGYAGATGSQAKTQRRGLLRGLQQDISGLRQDYISEFASGLYSDIRSGIFEPEALRTGINPNDPQTWPTGPAAGNLAGQSFTPPPQNPSDGDTWGQWKWDEESGEWIT